MDEWVMERYELAKERIAQIPDEKMAEEPYCDFLQRKQCFTAGDSCDGPWNCGEKS